jgi:AraC-like DNA-binding protein
VRVVHLAPSEALSPFIKRLTLVESRAGATRALLPETGLILGIRYRGAAVELGEPPQRLPDVAMTGLRHRARRMQTLPDGGIVLVTFREGRAATFFREPLHELYGNTLALSSILPAQEVELVRERVAEGSDDAARFSAVEQFLLARRGVQPADHMVNRAVDAIIEAQGALRVDVLAQAAGLSRDRFEKRFRRVVGAAPKRMATLLRLRTAIAGYRPGASLAALAAASGYYDQAHFSRDFRAFTGQPPKRFFQSIDYC